MAKFKYTAIDSSGRQKNGTIVAKSEEDANAQLSGMGLMVSSLVPDTAGAKGGGKSKAGMGSATGRKSGGISIGKIVKEEELTVFTRQMATLLQAGLPLLRSLEVMIRQEKNPRFREVLNQIADNVRSGNNLSDGLAQHPKVFDRLYVNMIKAGEAGGVLDVVLNRLALFMEKSLRIKKKVKSAMIYPIVIIGVAVAIVVLLMAFVVPRFQQIFAEILGGAQMPALTQFVIGISEFIQHHWIASMGIVAAVIIGFRAILKTKKGRYVFDWLMLNAPKIKDLASKAAVSRFARTFGTLLSSGVPILQALTITRDIIGNQVLMNALDKVHDRVRDGEPLAGPLEQQGVFPTMVTSMIDVGEETGELSEMLNRIADNYDEDVDNAVASITSIIEPVMIVFLALGVGTIVIALFLPIISIIQRLTGG